MGAAACVPGGNRMPDSLGVGGAATCPCSAGDAPRPRDAGADSGGWPGRGDAVRVRKPGHARRRRRGAGAEAATVAGDLEGGHDPAHCWSGGERGGGGAIAMARRGSGGGGNLSRDGVLAPCVLGVGRISGCVFVFCERGGGTGADERVSLAVGMALDCAIGGAGAGGPLRTALAAGPAGVEAQTGDNEEDMIATGVDGDPVAGPIGAVAAELD